MSALPNGAQIGNAAINDRGQLVGAAFVGSQMQATLTTHFVPQALGTLPGGTYSYAGSLNFRGEVTGVSTVSGGDSHAFLWKNGTMKDLGTLPGGSYSYGDAINNRGEITGQADVTGGLSHVFLYSKGELKDLGTLSGDGQSYGYSINDSAQITGWGYVNGGASYHAFLWAKGSYKDLGTLSSTSYGSQGLAINDFGQVTGYSYETSGTRSFLYTAGKMVDLGLLPGANSSVPVSLNNFGEVVGLNNFPMVNDIPVSSAYLYSQAQVVDLNTLIEPGSGWDLQGATGINDLGEIIGNGMFNGSYDSFLLEPRCPDDDGWKRMKEDDQRKNEHWCLTRRLIDRKRE